MVYFWGLLWLISSFCAGLSMELHPNGTPRQISSSHCKLSVNSLTSQNVSDIPCTATAQSYGWPVIVTTHYSDITTSDGITLSTYQTSLDNSKFTHTSRAKYVYNFLIAAGSIGAVVAVLLLLAEWRPKPQYASSVHK